MNSFTSSSVNSARLFWCSITIGCTQERQGVKPKRRSTHVHKASIHTVTVSIKIFFTSPVINRPALYSVRIWEYIRQCVVCYATPSIVGHSVCNPLLTRSSSSSSSKKKLRYWMETSTCVCVCVCVQSHIWDSHSAPSNQHTCVHKRKPPCYRQWQPYLNVGSQLPVQLSGLLATAKGVLVDLLLDLLGRVGDIDGRVGVACAHLGLGALQSWEELRVNECGLAPAQAGRHVTRQAEVRVLSIKAVGVSAIVNKGTRQGGGGGANLVNGLWDEADHVLGAAQDGWEGGGKGRSSLDCREHLSQQGCCNHHQNTTVSDRERQQAAQGVLGLTVVATTYNFANVGGHVKPKGAADLVKGDALLDAQDVGVHGAHVVQVGKDEGLVGKQGGEQQNSQRDLLDAHIEAGRHTFLGSNPQAIMSLAFSQASLWTSSMSSGFHRYFSSSVSWMTSGTLNASCSHCVNWKGIKWPMCSAVDDGPLRGVEVDVV